MVRLIFGEPYFLMNTKKGTVNFLDSDDSRQQEKTKIKIRSNNVGNRKVSYKWVLTIIIWTFFISCLMQTLQEGLMSKVNLLCAFMILIGFILVGILFDIVGVSVTAASEVPFHSLCSRKVRGAKEAVRLIRNADKVGNFCNDVIGDIAGIISGSAAGAIVVMLHSYAPGSDEFILSVILAGMVAALTVGGKAFGKGIALLKCNSIIFTVGKLISFIAPVKEKKIKKTKKDTKEKRSGKNGNNS